MSRPTPSSLERIVPAIGWLRGYQAGWLRADLVAGITLAAYLMPAGIGDASLAGLPPESGLYALLLGANLDLAGHGVQVLGEVPQGLPQFGIPMLERSDLNALLPLAMACFLLGAVETAAIGRMFARKHKYRLDSNQEFLALAGANLAAGLGQGFPTSGGMSQSLVNESSGARTPLSGFIASILILLVILFLSGLLKFLPQPVLAAIVLVAVTELFNIGALNRMWHFSRGEFAVAITALLGVLGSGLLMGVLIGAVLSILLLLHRAMQPHTTELGRVPGTDYFADRIRHPKNERIPGVFIFRSDGGIFYFNAEHVSDRFLELLGQREDAIKLAIYFLGTVPMLDMAGVEFLTELRETLRTRGIELRLAEARSGVRDALRRGGFEQHYGPIEPDQTVAIVLSRTPTSRTPEVLI